MTTDSARIVAPSPCGRRNDNTSTKKLRHHGQLRQHGQPDRLLSSVSSRKRSHHRRGLSSLTFGARRRSGAGLAVPILLAASQIPYLWQSGAYYARLHGSASLVDVLRAQAAVQQGNRGEHTVVVSSDANGKHSPSRVLSLTTNTVSVRTKTAVMPSWTEDSANSSAISGAVVPPRLYDPQASGRPLAIRWIGRKDDDDDADGNNGSPSLFRAGSTTASVTTRAMVSASTTALWEDAIGRSRYTTPILACWYDGSPFPSAGGGKDSGGRGRGGRGEEDRVKVNRYLATDRSQTSYEDVVVTIVDWASLERDCHVLGRILAHPECQLEEEEVRMAGGAGAPESPSSLLRVLSEPSTLQQQQQPMRTRRRLLVYWDSTNSPHPKVCEDSSLLSSSASASSSPPPSSFDIDAVFYVQRSTVQGRQWDAVHDYIAPGQRLHRDPRKAPSQAGIAGWHHSGHPLREEFVRQLVKTARKDTLESLSRRNRSSQAAVLHCNPSSGVPYSAFRRRISAVVLEVAQKHNLTSNVVKEEVVVGTNADAVQNDLVSKEYVQALLESQIVVVASHDEWEGHWQLWEAMASGAMVLAEAMVSPPPGMENGTHAVTFDSVSSLRRLLLYYAQHDDERVRIALRGQELALGLHRTWHDLERVLFGLPLTNARMPFAEAPPRGWKNSS